MPRTASLRDMLLAFLRAELDSPTEAGNLRVTLSNLHLQEDTIRGERAEEETLLYVFEKYRGWQDVFDGLDFPAMRWSFIELSLLDLNRKTHTCRNHFEQRYGTRLPAEIAAAWDSANMPNGVMAKISQGQTLEPPVLISDPSLGKFVILEGHNRLVSYLRSADQVPFPIPAIVGTAENVLRWSQW